LINTDQLSRVWCDPARMISEICVDDLSSKQNIKPKWLHPAGGPASDIAAQKRPLLLLSTTRLRSVLAAAFLPAGWPSSVSPDYASFQVLDTLQGVSSYVRGMLTSQALLQGIGVGSSVATPAAATLQLFTRDATGHVASLLFATTQSTSFDAYPKQWRLVADIANDVGMAFELIAPLFPAAFVLLACFGALCRSITGVAGGATRAALTQHFARTGNAADITAKEGTQETFVTLLGMIFGLGLARLAAAHQGAAWSIFALLTILHVWANALAMRCLQLARLNPSRLDLLLENYCRCSKVLTPAEIAPLESLMPPPLLRACALIGICRTVPPIRVAPSLESMTRAVRKRCIDEATRLRIWDGEVRHCTVMVPERNHIIALLGDTGRSRDQEHISIIAAYCAARVASRHLNGGRAVGARTTNRANILSDKELKSSAIEASRVWMKEANGFGLFLRLLGEAGWELERPVLLQGPYRIQAVGEAEELGGVFSTFQGSAASKKVN
jgi:hypothetical protein